MKALLILTILFTASLTYAGNDSDLSVTNAGAQVNCADAEHAGGVCVDKNASKLLLGSDTNPREVTPTVRDSESAE